MRIATWTIVVLAALNVLFLVSLPQVAESFADQLHFARPGALPPKPQPIPERRDEPLVPISELNEKLRLPRVDTTLTDEHSKASLAAYRSGDYKKAFEEAVLSLDPTPLETNELYQALTGHDSKTIKKPNGRVALESVDEAVQDSLDKHNPQHAAARLNNAASMLILYLYSTKPSVPYVDSVGDSSIILPTDQAVPQELAYQAADLRTSYCPALLNLTLFDRSATNDPKSAGSGA